MHFQYLPHERANHPMNVDSAEYANIVLSFTRFYEQARRPACRARRASRAVVCAVDPARGRGLLDARRLRELGLRARLRALASVQEARAHAAGADRRRLRAVAPATRSGSATRSGCSTELAEFYSATADRDGGIADALFFNVHVRPAVSAARDSARRACSANAARAIDAGLGRARSSGRPRCTRIDPDIGRLAVTTPAYSTAIVAVNQRAFPYGGLDLARLFDGDQDVAANIGGTPPASFGALVRDVSGRRVLASQVARDVAWTARSRRCS